MSNLIVKRDSFEIQDLNMKRKDVVLHQKTNHGDDRYGDYFYYKGRTLTQMLEEYVNEF